jgi:hypothetical protein
MLFEKSVLNVYFNSRVKLPKGALSVDIGIGLELPPAVHSISSGTIIKVFKSSTNTVKEGKFVYYYVPFSDRSKIIKCLVVYVF